MVPKPVFEQHQREQAMRDVPTPNGMRLTLNYSRVLIVCRQVDQPRIGGSVLHHPADIACSRDATVCMQGFRSASSSSCTVHHAGLHVEVPSTDAHARSLEGYLYSYRTHEPFSTTGRFSRLQPFLILARTRSGCCSTDKGGVILRTPRIQSRLAWILLSTSRYITRRVFVLD